MSNALGEFERFLLFALLHLSDADRYGVPIREEIERRSGRPVSAGAVYTALSRLEERGFVSSKLGDATAERGGRSKRFYSIEHAGVEALHHSVQMFDAMSRGLLPRLNRMMLSGGDDE